MTRIVRKSCSLLALAVLCATPLLASDARAMDVQYVEIFWLYDRFEGTPIPNPYGMEIFVEGTGIDSVEAVTPGTAGTFNLVNVFGNEWEIPGSVTTQFSSSTDLFNAFSAGSYTFNISGDGGASNDTVSRPLSPTEVTDYLVITSPTGAGTWPRDLTITWVDCSGCDGVRLGGFVEDDDEDVSMFTDTDKSRTTWSPTGLQFGAVYDVEMILGDFDFWFVSDTTDTLSDPFTFEAGYESINIIGLEIERFEHRVPALGGRGRIALAALLLLMASAGAWRAARA